MSHNLEYLLSRPGALKIMTIIFGIVTTILSGHSYGESPYTDYYHEEFRLHNNSKNLPGTEMEAYSLSTSAISLGVSAIYLTLYSVFYALCESRLNKFVDTSFHFCVALLLFCGGTILIFNAIQIEERGCDHLKFSWSGPTPKYFDPLVTFFSVFHKKGKAIVTSEVKNQLLDGNEQFCHYLGEKIVAGMSAIEILNSIIYGFLRFVIFTTQIEEL